MADDLETGASSLADVIELVLDKGLVVDTWARISLAGLEIVAIDARVLVSTFDAFFKDAKVANTHGHRGPGEVKFASQGWRRATA